MRLHSGFLWLPQSERVHSPPPYAPQHHLLTSHVKVDSVITLILSRSKTNQFGRPQTVVIGSTESSTCPVRAMKRYLVARQQYPSGPLLRLEDGSLLSCKDIYCLKLLLQDAGLDSSRYSSHSFQIGAATTAAASGLPDHLIQRLGHWRSDAYKRYIRPSPPAPLQLTRAPSSRH